MKKFLLICLCISFVINVNGQEPSSPCNMKASGFATVKAGNKEIVYIWWRVVGESQKLTTALDQATFRAMNKVAQFLCTQVQMLVSQAFVDDLTTSEAIYSVWQQTINEQVKFVIEIPESNYCKEKVDGKWIVQIQYGMDFTSWESLVNRMMTNVNTKMQNDLKEKYDEVIQQKIKNTLLKGN